MAKSKAYILGRPQLCEACDLTHVADDMIRRDGLLLCPTTKDPVWVEVYDLLDKATYWLKEPK